MNNKERLCDKFYNWIVRDMRADANRRSGTKAWVVTWHLRLDWGYDTSQINYHLNKLVKEGKMIKRSNRHCTEFSPTEIYGFVREGDDFKWKLGFNQHIK